MPHTVAILEKDANRILEMEACLVELLPGTAYAFFDNAQEMVAWLTGNLADVVVVSLDHDLPVVQYRVGRRVDAGCGRVVADYLAALPPICPIVIHTSNAERGAGMEQVLKEAGWPTRRVHPFEDYEWVRKAWAPTIQKLIQEGWIAKEASAGAASQHSTG